MLKLGIFCVMVIYVAGLTTEDPEHCPPEEEYKECGSACAPTCSARQKRCSAVCIKGCFCKPGLVRDVDLECVEPSNCKKLRGCKRDERYYECPPTSKNTCENYGNRKIPYSCDPPGCFCNYGFVKRKDGACVEYKDCDKGN